MEGGFAHRAHQTVSREIELVEGLHEIAIGSSARGERIQHLNQNTAPCLRAQDLDPVVLTTGVSQQEAARPH